MTTLQRVIKYAAMAFAIFLIVSIFSSILFGLGMISGVSNKTHESELLQTNENGEAVTATDSNMRKLNVQKGVSFLEVDLTCCGLEIYKANEFAAETNCPTITENTQSDKLIIKDNNVNFTNSDYVLRIFLPQKTLEEIKINTGAGRFYSDSLLADKIEINFGAGDARIEKIEAKAKLELEVGAGRAEVKQLDSFGKTDIELGAGRLSVQGGKIANSDIDLGMGSADIQGEFLQQGEVNVGMGRLKLTLAGAKDNYSFETSKGIGSVTVGGVSMGDDSTYLNGGTQISIECGAGNVTVDFAA